MIFYLQVVAPGVAGSNNFVYIQNYVYLKISLKEFALLHTLELYLRYSRETEYRHLNLHSVLLLSFAPRNYHFQKKHIHDNRHYACAIAWVVFVRICKYVVVLSEREKPTHASFLWLSVVVA